MAALKIGTAAPEFSLPTTDGKKFSLAEARTHGPVLMVFFKVSCPVCQFSLPYLERIHKSYGKGRLTVVGISQNPLKETLAFMREYGISFPVALDDPKSYAVSNQYGLTNVPTVFLISPEGKIQVSSVGWVRNEIEEANRSLAQAASAAPGRIFKSGEDIPEFKAG